MWNLNLLQPDKSIHLLHNKESWHMCYISSPCCLVECLTSIPLRSSTWNFSLMQTVCKQPYAVALLIILFPKELTHLSGIGTWKWLGHQNGSPHVILSKQDGTFHWVSTFSGFNWFIKLRLIPIIIDVLHRCSWYKSFTKLDINMHLNWIMSPGKSVSLLHPWHLSILLIAHGS